MTAHAPRPAIRWRGYTTPPPPGAGGVPTATRSATPAAGHWQLAGWWRRVGAHLLDCVVLGVVAVVLFLVLGAIFGSGFLVGDTTGIIAIILGFIIWLLCIVVAALFYAPLMMARTNGQTLGPHGARDSRRPRERPADRRSASPLLREVAVKWLLIDVDRRLGHRRHRAADRLPLAAVGRGEPRAARLRRRHADDPRPS